MMAFTCWQPLTRPSGAQAEMITTGTSQVFLSAVSCCKTSRPSMPGICRSSVTTEGRCSLTALNPSRPSLHPSTRKPIDSSNVHTISLTQSSSSTTTARRDDPPEDTDITPQDVAASHWRVAESSNNQYCCVGIEIRKRGSVLIPQLHEQSDFNALATDVKAREYQNEIKCWHIFGQLRA